MADAAEYARWIQANRDKKGSEKYNIVAQAYKDALMQEYSKVVDPTEDMSTTEKVLAGAGKAFVDTGRGIGQLVGAVSNEDVAESRKTDAALMNTTAGKAGNFGGHVSLALPTMLIPGAATVRGAALIGGGQGFIQPTVNSGERLTNTALGAAAGPAAILAGRGALAAAQGGRALVAPFTQAGREQIAGRMIQRFAEDPTRVAAAQGGRSATGAAPTLAEETGDRGIAQLQDSLRSVDPQIANRIASRLSENNAARVNALASLAGDSGKRAAAESAREAATKPLYQQAVSQTVDISPELTKLLARPSVQKALSRAQNIAAEEGRDFGLDATSGKITGQTLQDLKMGLDALLKDSTSGIAGKEAVNIKATRDAIVDAMEQAIPAFKGARTGYATASKPLNGMDVGAEIAKRGTSATSDLAGNPRMQANALLRMLQDEAGLIKSATGRKELSSLDQVFEPDQLALLRAVAGETDRAAAVASAGAGPGSATAQRMASQNILRQIIGPTGLPESWAESVIANTVIGKPFNLVYGGVAEPKIQMALADALLDPAAARAALAAAQRPGFRLPNNPLANLIANSGRASSSAAAVSGQGGK